MAGRRSGSKVIAEQGVQIGASSVVGQVLKATDTAGNTALGNVPGARVVAGGNLGTTSSLDVANDHDVWLTGTLNGNCTLTLTNLPTDASRVKLLLVQDATGGRTLTLAHSADSTVLPISHDPSVAVVVDIYSADGSVKYVDVAGGGGGAPFGVFTSGDIGKASVWDGTQFIPDSARELAYVEDTAGFTTTSTSLVDSPLGTISVPATLGPVEIEFYAPIVGHSNAAGTVSAYIMETTSGTVQRQASYMTEHTNNGYLGPLRVYKRLAASGSTRTFKVQINQSGGTAYYVVDASGGAVHFTARRL